MPDRFTEVKQRSWGQNIAQSVSGAVLGVVLFFGSFGVLWWNEGRQDMSLVAARTRPVAAQAVAVEAEGQPVSVSANLVTTETLGDEPNLQPGEYVALVRDVEMFAWVEEKKEEEREKFGGGTEVITTYNYVKEWTSSPENSGNFAHPEGHENPRQTIEKKEWRVSAAKVGAYNIQPKEIELPSANPIGDFIFLGKGTSGAPQIGDQRLRYRAVPNNIFVTAFGKLSGDTVVPYWFKGEDKLYRALTGDRENAIATLKTEHKMMTWILRGVGFVMMWFGLSLVFGPFLALAGVLPFLKQLGRFVISLVTFAVAFVLSLLTIIISMIAHNIWALIAAVVMVLGLVIFFLKTRQKKVIEKV